jgi:hypothetical protein
VAGIRPHLPHLRCWGGARSCFESKNVTTRPAAGHDTDGEREAHRAKSYGMGASKHRALRRGYYVHASLPPGAWGEFYDDFDIAAEES